VDVKLAVIDLSEQELRADLDREDLSQSALNELLVVRPKLRGGEGSFNVILLDQQLGNSIADIELLGRLSQVAHDASARLLVGLTNEAAGCSEVEAFHVRELQPSSAAWQSLRQLPDVQQTIAVWPGFLLRQPYGKLSSEVESLALEELAGLDPAATLLAGNGAYLAAAQLIRQHEEDADNTFSGFPCIVLQDTGGKQMVPASGLWLRDAAIEQLLERGIVPVVGLLTAGSLRLFALRSISIHEDRNS